MNAKKIITGFVVLSFVAAAVLALGMNMHESESMPGCPLMSVGSSVCTMNGVDKSVFVADRGGFVKLIFIGFVALLNGVFVYSEVLNNVRLKLQKKKTDLAKLFDHIRQSLSAGTLNPKVYFA